VLSVSRQRNGYLLAAIAAYAVFFLSHILALAGFVAVGCLLAFALEIAHRIILSQFPTIHQSRHAAESCRPKCYEPEMEEEWSPRAMRSLP
jgi:hypothetical protein